VAAGLRQRDGMIRWCLTTSWSLRSRTGRCSVAGAAAARGRSPVRGIWCPGGRGPLAYIAVIDCSALRAVPLDIALPQAGMLLFYDIQVNRDRKIRNHIRQVQALGINSDNLPTLLTKNHRQPDAYRTRRPCHTTRPGSAAACPQRSHISGQVNG
jgi:hypothetical protein